MTDSSKMLAGAFATLRDNGFKKKGLVWCSRSDETVFSFELQTSAHHNRYFVNIGVWLLSLGEASHLPPNRCHVYGRIGDREVETALDFDSAPTTDRRLILEGFKSSVLLPIAAECATQHGAAELLKSGTLRVPMVRPEARPILLAQGPARG